MSGMDMNRLRQQHERVEANSGQDFGDIPKLVVTNGMSIRLIGDYESSWEHFAKGTGGLRPFYCEGPDSDCPLCAAVSQLSVSEDKDQQTLAGEIKAKEKFYFNALDRSPVGRQEHANTKKAKLLVQSARANNIGSMLFRGIADVCAMRESQGQPSDPNGYDIVLSKKGSGIKTEYGAQFSGMTDPLTDEEMAYELVPLKQIARVSKREELQVAADIALGRVGQSAPAQQSQPASTTAATATGPVQASQAARPQQAATVAQQPAAAPAGPQPAVAPNTAQPAARKLNIRPKAEQPQHQTTEQKEGDSIIEVPCSADGCGITMFIDMDDTRDIKCHNCGAVYDHPAKS